MRITIRVKQSLLTPRELNECWSIDFMSDSLSDGRKVRVFNIIDDCNREALVIKLGLNYPVKRVIKTLEELEEEEEVGLCITIRSDNGTEFL